MQQWLFTPKTGRWLLSSSSCEWALSVVDGKGRFDGQGAHYSRRTPGSATFTGVGREIVLVTECGRAVWAVVEQGTPPPRGSGRSRGRGGVRIETPRLWRNMVFRNLGAGLSSALIEEATRATYVLWWWRYGAFPRVSLRTEIDVNEVQSSNPGFCYECAGWIRGALKRGKRFMYAPSCPILPPVAFDAD